MSHSNIYVVHKSGHYNKKNAEKINPESLKREIEYADGCWELTKNEDILGGLEWLDDYIYKTYNHHLWAIEIDVKAHRITINEEFKRFYKEALYERWFDVIGDVDNGEMLYDKEEDIKDFFRPMGGLRIATVDDYYGLNVQTLDKGLASLDPGVYEIERIFDYHF